jgi:hypothetical protein
MKRALFEPNEVPAKKLLEDFRKFIGLDAATRQKVGEVVVVRAVASETEDESLEVKVKDLLRDWRGDREVFADAVGMVQYVLDRAKERGLLVADAVSQLADFLKPDVVSDDVKAFFRGLEDSAVRVWTNRRQSFTNGIGTPVYQGASYACQLRPVFGAKYDKEQDDKQSYFGILKWSPSLVLDLTTEANGERTNVSMVFSPHDLRDLSEILERARKRLAKVEAAADRLNKTETEAS